MMCGHRVLVADDEPDIRNILRRTLLGAGFCVCEAGNGAEALAVAEHCDVNVILMDVMMPRMSGTEAVRQLRANPRFAHIPVVFITASVATPAQPSQVGDMLLLSKPLNLDQLLTTVHQLASGAKTARSAAS
jgi:CheY-like chemotaxis protein